MCLVLNLLAASATAPTEPRMGREKAHNSTTALRAPLALTKMYNAETMPATYSRMNAASGADKENTRPPFRMTEPFPTP